MSSVVETSVAIIGRDSSISVGMTNILKTKRGANAPRFVFLFSQQEYL